MHFYPLFGIVKLWCDYQPKHFIIILASMCVSTHRNLYTLVLAGSPAKDPAGTGKSPVEDPAGTIAPLSPNY
jgi:hypothetical protein